MHSPVTADTRSRIRWRSGAVIASILWLAGCASGIPPEIRNAPDPNPALASVRANPVGSVGEFVRWGGEVVTTENLESATQVEIVARGLYRDGYPQSTLGSDGRFIARIEGFVEPLLLQKGRLITVYGQITGSLRRDIGEYPYEYPVVKVSTYRLWEPPAVDRYPYPRYGYWPWYDPWYDPWRFPYSRYRPPPYRW